MLNSKRTQTNSFKKKMENYEGATCTCEAKSVNLTIEMINNPEKQMVCHTVNIFFIWKALPFH